MRDARERWIGFVAFLAAGVIGLAMYAAAPFAPFGLTLVILGTGGLGWVLVSAIRADQEGLQPCAKDETGGRQPAPPGDESVFRPRGRPRPGP